MAVYPIYQISCYETQIWKKQAGGGEDMKVGESWFQWWTTQWKKNFSYMCLFLEDLPPFKKYAFFYFVKKVFHSLLTFTVSHNITFKYLYINNLAIIYSIFQVRKYV